jgi:hypothetical protein
VGGVVIACKGWGKGFFVNSKAVQKNILFQCPGNIFLEKINQQIFKIEFFLIL